jgi:AraC-like DNA-binding protein/quercetin dioxygenase-like cupin family protein
MQNIPVRHIQSNKKEPVLSGNFSIRAIELLMEGEDMTESLHRHDFFYILVLTKGAGNHEIDFVPYEITDHSIFILRPGQVHQLTLKAGSKGYLIQFNREFFQSDHLAAKEAVRKGGQRNVCVLEESSFGKLTAMLNYLLSEFAGRQERYEEVIRSGLVIFFIELARHGQSTENKTAVVNQYYQEKLEEFFELLDANIKDSKKVSHYAGKLNLSIYQLGAITKSLLDKTPSDIINEHIILEAKRQLLATSNQVNQIAYDLGYDDPSYFIRFFKKHTAHSPEHFRNISK